MATPNDPEPIRAVGFIGLGDQGGPCREPSPSLASASTSGPRRPASLRALDGVPCVAHSSAADLAGACDLLSLPLNDDRDVLDVLDRQGVLQALKPGTPVVNHGTGDPNDNRRIASMLAAAGFMYLDAPVSGGRPAAIARTLTTMVGGDESTFARCEPVFAAFSGKCAYMGRSGNGQMTKLLNNALTMTNLKNVSDVFSLAERLGVDLAAFYGVVSASSGSSRILEALPQLTVALASHLQVLMKKDVEHFADGIRSNGQDPTGLRERGLAGALELVDVVRLLTEAQRSSRPATAAP
jgi:3-hydroxyisobutyrate dehydrogenase-like beta-hydroxyacid dehydrogenase